MAKAERVTPPEEIVLNLSEEEAHVLRNVLGSFVFDDPHISPLYNSVASVTHGAHRNRLEVLNEDGDWVRAIALRYADKES